jgi:hypothetical protein
LLHQRTLSRLCNGVNTAPKYGLLGLMPCCRSRLRTVCELILRNPGIPVAVVDAKTVRFRRWKTRMYRSCPGVVMQGLPLLWQSFVEPVCWNLFHSLEMVLWLTFRICATWFWDSPAWRGRIAIFRVAGSNLGMAAYQLSNKSQTSNLVLYIRFSLIVELTTNCRWKTLQNFRCDTWDIHFSEALCTCGREPNLMNRHLKFKTYL